MAAPDLFALLVLPPLRERFVAEAPGIAVTGEEPVGSVAGKLETGALDLAIVPELAAVDVGERPAPDLRRRLLVREGFRVFVGRRGPLGDLGRLGPKAYREAPHLVVSPRGGGATQSVNPGQTATVATATGNVSVSPSSQTAPPASVSTGHGAVAAHGGGGGEGQ